MPKLACDKNDVVSYLSFADPKPQREIGLVTRRSFTRHAILRKIIDILIPADAIRKP